jgi:hypothetical protein
VDLVAGVIRPAGTIPRHCNTPEKVGPPPQEALLPSPVGVGRFVIRATQRAWGWRAVQSELGDGLS